MTEENEDEGSRIKKDHLLLLADYLDELPANRFYYGTYATSNFDPANLGSGYHPCQSTACAIGHCASIPFFRKLGLTLTSRALNVYDGVNVKTPRIVPEKSKLAAGECATTQEMIEEVAEVIFGLTETEWLYLFVPKEMMDREERYIDQLPATASPRQVARHIRDFCRFGIGTLEYSEHEAAEQDYYDEEPDD